MKKILLNLAYFLVIALLAAGALLLCAIIWLASGFVNSIIYLFDRLLR